MRKLLVFGLSLALLTLAGTAFAKEFKTGGLNGGEEVPQRDTNARGNATFEVSADGLSMTYKLIVANIDNIIQAHIHIAPAGVNGPVVLFLHELVPPGGGTSNGLIRQGTVTAANLVGPLAGQPLSSLISAMSAGNAYVNVHTNDGVGAINTGPGDFPGGEIRGQIRD